MLWPLSGPPGLPVGFPLLWHSFLFTVEYLSSFSTFAIYLLEQTRQSLMTDTGTQDVNTRHL